MPAVADNRPPQKSAFGLPQNVDAAACELIVKQATSAIRLAKDMAALEEVRIGYLGKRGVIPLMFARLKHLDRADKASSCKELNAAKRQISNLVADCGQKLSELLENRRNEQEFVDITLPGIKQDVGTFHPITLVMNRIEDLLYDAGFEVEFGPEVEDNYHNFEALNIPLSHPARAMHDTFYLTNGLLLRTHTSPVQIHVMTKRPPPLKIIAPGKVYRRDLDPTHSPMFHQVEGLCIGSNVTFADLKSLLEDFLHAFFDHDVALKIRFRPSYFPFTEPSCEVDICRLSSSQGKLKTKEQWIEVMGAGMVHPNVVRNVGYDPDKQVGYAFGLGVERLAMLYYGMEDMRSFYENDLRFLRQFKETL